MVELQETSPARLFPIRSRAYVFIAVILAFLVSLLALSGDRQAKRVTGPILPSREIPIPSSRSVTDALMLENPRVVVLKSKRELHLFDRDSLIRTYPVDLGLEPIGDKRRRNDNRTPEGSFQIVTKNAESAYHRFLGIDYPNGEAVDRGLAAGLISPGEAAAILDALRDGRCPSWSTELGGGIGLHGHGQGRDWTAGCMAVADEDIEELFRVMRVGDRVDILP